jgi:hypothetical protein
LSAPTSTETCHPNIMASKWMPACICRMLHRISCTMHARCPGPVACAACRPRPAHCVVPTSFADRGASPDARTRRRRRREQLCRVSPHHDSGARLGAGASSWPASPGRRAQQGWRHRNARIPAASETRVAASAHAFAALAQGGMLKAACWHAAIMPSCRWLKAA